MTLHSIGLLSLHQLFQWSFLLSHRYYLLNPLSILLPLPLFEFSLILFELINLGCQYQLHRHPLLLHCLFHCFQSSQSHSSLTLLVSDFIIHCFSLQINLSHPWIPLPFPSCSLLLLTLVCQSLISHYLMILTQKNCFIFLLLIFRKSALLNFNF